MNLTDHFTLEELVFSQTAVRDNIDNKPNNGQFQNLKNLCVNILEPVRVSINRPIAVTSGFRSERLNKAVGGSPDSQHMKGQAADIVCFGMSAKSLFKRILELGIPYDQIIYEGAQTNAWVHISFDAVQSRRSILLATFPPAGGVQYAKLTKTEAMNL